MFEIHQQKGEVIKDVDRGELLGEFEAIEQSRPVLDEADIAQVQVAVAVPDLARGAPPLEHGADRSEPLQRALPDLGDALGGKSRLSRRREAAMVRLDNGSQRRSAAMIGPALGRLMERRNLTDELDH